MASTSQINNTIANTSNNDNRDKLLKLQSSTSKSILIKEKENILNIQEISVTIRRHEKGYGFELTDGIHITRVHQNSPAFNAGIQEGDIVRKVNGTSIHDKQIVEITRMIHESNPFVALTLQRKLYGTSSSSNNNNNSSNNHSESNNNIYFKNNNSQNDIYAYNNNKDNNNIIEKFDLIQQNLTIKSNINNNNNNKMSNTNAPINNSIAGRNSGRRVCVKKVSTSTTEVRSRFHQTQSLTDISISMDNNNSNDDINNHNGSQSDHENDEYHLNKDNDIQIPYKDDISANNHYYTSNNEESCSNENDRSQFELDGFGDFNRLLQKPINLATFLNYLVSESNENPKYFYFCLFVDELINFKEKNETFIRCTNEIFTTFLQQQSPLQLDLNEDTIRQLEEILVQCNDKTANDQQFNIKSLLDELKSETLSHLNNQLHRYREVKALEHNHNNKQSTNENECASFCDSSSLAYYYNGRHNTSTLKKSDTKKSTLTKSLSLANMFQSEAFKTPQVKSEQQIITELFKKYLNDLCAQSNQITDWNDSRPNEAFISSLISCFLTYSKRYALTIKTIGRFEYDKVPTFLNRKYKPKKNQTLQKHGHILSDTLIPLRSTCLKCTQPFWGIGSQGLVCLKSKCDTKLHRICLSSGFTHECHGTLKTNIKDDTFSSFKRMLRNSFINTDFDKKKEMEDSKSKFYDPDTSDDHTSFASQPSSSIASNRHFSMKDTEEGCLPVKKAIEKYEKISSINNNEPPKPTSPIGHAPKMIATIETREIKETINHNKKENIKMINNSSNSILPNKSTNLFNTSSSLSSSNTLSTTNNTNNSTYNACKRVGSFKVDIKKSKANIPRSKSDPEPEEIKNAITTTSNNTIIQTPSTQTITNNNSILNDSSCITTSITPPMPINANETSSNVHAKSYKADVGDESTSNHIEVKSMINYSNSSCSDNLSVYSTAHNHPFSSSSSLPSSGPSLVSLNSNSYSTSVTSRHSWLNDSDVEVEDELPSIHSRDSSVDNLSKQDRKVQEVINELIHTEQKHVRNLKIMKNQFYIPIKFDYLLSEQELELLFPNLDEILELHSELNNELKKLRKEHSIVPLEDLIKIILNQFEGEKGTKFEEACARFCKDQKEAMELLRSKMRILNEKFSQFMMRAEAEPICRKLHLKDFIPTEVQRLTKYGLLFRELNKITDDEKHKKKLEKCMNASTRISQFVNKAVMECENKKRVKEIQSKMDTSLFDQYFAKYTLLKPYKNLDILGRKLIYEGELEWKVTRDGNPKFTALLFEDILIFLEKNSATGRYSLKPMLWTIGKEKHTFTPIIRMNDIHQIKEMPDRRGFHMTVFIDNDTKSTKKKLESKMLFILDANSGDERNKWTNYLQELSGVRIAKSGGGGVDNSSHASTTSSTSTTSSSQLVTNQETVLVKQVNTVVDETMPTLNDDQLTDSIGDSLPVISPIPTKEELEAELSNQLELNTKALIEIMSQRNIILQKLIENQLRSSPSVEYSPTQHQATSSHGADTLLNQCTSLLDTLTETLIKETTPQVQLKFIDSIATLHKNVNNLRLNKNELRQESDSTARLPDLNSTVTNSNSDKSLRNSLRRASNSSDTTLVTTTPTANDDEEPYEDETSANDQLRQSLKQADINELSEDEVIHENVSFSDNNNSDEDEDEDEILPPSLTNNEPTNEYKIILKSDKIESISTVNHDEDDSNEGDDESGDSNENDEVTTYFIHNETNDEVSHV